MKLQVDFVGDWINSLRESLSDEWGYNISKVSDDEIPQLYFNAINKRPQTKARNVILSDTFNCPRELEKGWELLRTRVENGDDLTANLSKLVNKIKYKDLMLNDWGVHHFHLGDKMNGAFIERGKPLLFALLKGSNFYVVGIYDHSSWLDRDIIEVIHRNWPKVIENKIMQGVQESKGLSEEDQKKLRKASINFPITISDGTTYALIGGGFAGGAYTLDVIMEIDRRKSLLRELEVGIERHLTKDLEVFNDTNYDGKSNVKAVLKTKGNQLKLEDNQYTVLLPDYDISIDLKW